MEAMEKYISHGWEIGVGQGKKIPAAFLDFSYSLGWKNEEEISLTSPLSRTGQSKRKRMRNRVT